MGYNTNYELRVATSDFGVVIGAFRDDILKELEDRGIINYAITSEGDTYDFCKWYEHDTDMLEISKKFPDLIFMLHGCGEDEGDLWYCYYKNGKKQLCKAQITYEAYDENKLK